MASGDTQAHLPRVLIMCLALLWSAAAFAQTFEPLTIVTKGARHPFQVEVARNDADRAQGLMFRRNLAPDRGMLFDFGRVQPISMWMQNTYIPLDMIFIRADGTIERIAANTVPHSLQSVTSHGPVAAVLEIAGGRAAQLGLSEGDRVSWPGGPRATR